MTFVENFPAFFADFGETATPASGAQIQVIFDKQFLAELGMAEGSDPIALCMDSDVSGFTHGTVLTIRGVAYTVREVRPDGTGITLLQLWAP